MKDKLQYADDTNDWEVSFNRGFDKLKKENHSEIENCMKGLHFSLDGFVNNINWNKIEPSTISITFEHDDDEVLKVVHSFFKKTKLNIEHDGYKKEVDSSYSGFFEVYLHCK